MDYLSASNSMVLNVLALSAEGWESCGPVVISGSCTERHQCVSPCDEKKTVGGSTKGQRLTGSVRLDNAEGQKENVWARKNLGIAQRLKCVGCMVF